MSRRSHAPLALVLAALALAPAAFAQPRDEAAQSAARTLGLAALELYDKGDYPRALEKFEQAAVNATNVFWLAPSAGQLYSASLADPTPKLLAQGPAPACAIAVFGTNIYWTSCEAKSTAGRIMRVGK